MSASREKRDRATQKTTGDKPVKGDAGSIIGRVIVRVLVAAAVLGVLALAAFGSNIPQRMITAVTIENEDISVAEFNFAFAESTSSFLSQYGSFLTQSGLDLTKPLASQPYDETQSWYDYLRNMSIENLKRQVLYGNLAKAEGIALTPEDNELIDMGYDGMVSAAKSSKMSFGKFLTTRYGRGVSGSNIRTFLERGVLASRYETEKRKAFTYTPEQIETHYTENAKNFDKVDFREFNVSKDMSEADKAAATANNIDLTATITSVVGDITLEQQKAFDTVNALAQNSELTADNFNELAKALAPEDQKASYDNADYTLRTGGTYSDSALKNWLFDPARKAGDVTVLDTDSTFSTVMFLERRQSTDPTVTVRQLLLQPETSVSAATDADWTNLLTEAEKIYKPIENTAVTEDAFVKLVTEHSDALYSRNDGGIFKDMARGTMGSDEADAWLYDPARVAGDHTMVKTDAGYVILYFVSQGRPEYQVEVEETLRTADYSKLRSENEFKSVGNPVVSQFGMTFVTKL